MKSFHLVISGWQKFFKHIQIAFAAVLLLFVVSSCSQDEGVGGQCHIKGKLVEKIYNDDYSLLLKEQPAKDEDVYLLFGNDQAVGEKTSSSYSGNFEFNYLWPGNYKLYYFSEEQGVNYEGEQEVLVEVSLSKKETVDLGELSVLKTVDFDEGNSTIRGLVMLTNYKNSSQWPNLVVKDVSPAQEQEVYLVYGNHMQFDDRIRTNDDGTFEFTNLIKGNYRIYVYSEDVSGGTEDIAVESNVTITAENEMITLENFKIEKH